MFNEISIFFFLDLRLILLEIQMLLHRFIQNNVTFDNYLGRNLNANNNERLYFKVTTNTGKKENHGYLPIE